MKKQAMFSFDHVEQTIIGTKSAIKRANVLGSAEYKELTKMMKAKPTYVVVEKVIQKKAEHKKTYSGLTIAKMKEFIETQENKEENLKLFEAIQKVAKARNALYPLTKQWFLTTFPSYNGEKAKTEKKKDVVLDEAILKKATEELNKLTTLKKSA